MHLSTELSADDILNGRTPFPASPAVESKPDERYLARERLTAVPPSGVHPRLLISPEDLPGLRKRWKETEAGRAMEASLHRRLNDALKPGSPAAKLYDALVAGDLPAAQALIDSNPKLIGTLAHYQFYMPTVMAWTALDALVNENAEQGKQVAAAITSWAKLIGPAVDRDLCRPMADDVFRIAAMPNVGDPPKTAQLDGKYRDLLGYHLVGYCYDFAFNFMDESQRSVVRDLIARSTNGRLWMGARLPHHFRNWNWIEIGLSQPLLALAIEGEPGFDPRVYKLGVEIATDYCNYGISPSGSATEAVGYMNFGLVWGNPFMVAASRRGDSLLTNAHYRAMPDWYIQSYQPGTNGFYQSHGDGGDAGPPLWTLQTWRYFFPTDPRVDFLFQNYARSTDGKPYDVPVHLIEALLFASDGITENGKAIDYQDGAKLGAPLTFFDPVRSSLNARSAWSPDATAVQFECRSDSVGASHEHADRGNFVFSALGRTWAREYYRSVETKYHNGILIDGVGQGYWPGPGKWLGQVDGGWAVLAACDAKQAYDWWWPKQIVSEDPKAFERFQYGRWAGYTKEAETFSKNYAGVPRERDDRPSVVAHWKDFLATDPRMWDEDSWPVRLPHNPVERAFRTIAFVKSQSPYLVVIDDIQKDKQQRNYEWLMMPGINTELISAKGDDIVLGDATVKRDADGLVKPQPGDRQLLVRVLDSSMPAPKDLHARALPRLETFERRDTNYADGRSFAVDKRLVIPSLAVAPQFKVLLFPYRQGQPTPKTTWNPERTQVTVQVGDAPADTLRFSPGADGRTRVTLSRPGQADVEMK
jgi:hypothetical protein